jgi:hypothetical protein
MKLRNSLIYSFAILSLAACSNNDSSPTGTVSAAPALADSTGADSAGAITAPRPTRKARRPIPSTWTAIP